MLVDVDSWTRGLVDLWALGGFPLFSSRLVSQHSGVLLQTRET